MVKLPLLVACIGYILGIILGLYLSIALFFIIILTYLVLLKFRKRALKLILPLNAIFIFLVSLLIGATYITILENRYSKIYEIADTIKVAGTIENVEKHEYSNKYIVKIDKIDGKNYGNMKLILYTKSKEDALEIGDYINTTANYISPDKARNFKGFSYRNYLKQNKIYGTVMPVSKVEIIKKNNINVVRRNIYKIKNSLINEINKHLSKDSAAVFQGIIFGEKSQISNEITEYFRTGNMAHILAVSGAHVSYIVLLFSCSIKRINKRFYIIITIVFLIFFMFLTNFSPSVVRASTMTIITLFSKLIYRKANIYNNLAISALIILIANPYQVFNIGFQLTYLGTIGIIVFSKRIFKKKEAVRNIKIKDRIFELAKVSLCVQILIFPIVVLNFNTLSYNFLIAGIVATPIFAGIMVLRNDCIYIISNKEIHFFNSRDINKSINIHI